MFGPTDITRETLLWGMGTGTREAFTFYSLDVKYLKTIVPNLFFETGLEFAVHTYYRKSGFYSAKRANLISIPLACRLRFFKNLFVNGGPLVDIDNSLPVITDRQSGIGAFMGGGIYFEYHRLTLSVSAQKQWHGIIQMMAQENHTPLVNYGFNGGFGYKF
jgi:hypothetical protein